MKETSRDAGDHIGVLGFKEELAFQAEHPPAGDPRIAAFAKAMQGEAEQEPVQTLLEQYYASRGNMGKSESVKLWLSSAQNLLWTPENPNYPEANDKERVWQKDLRSIFEDPNKRSQFVNSIMNDLLYSDVFERFKAIKLVLALFGSRFEEPPRILNDGCSRNLGLKKLALNLPFRPIEVVDQPIDEVVSTKGRKNSKLSEALNQLLLRNIEIGLSYGVDIHDLKSKEHARLTRSHSFYPSEIPDNDLVQEYDYLDGVEVPNVGFIQGDFANDELIESKFIPEQSGFDLIVFSTVLNELSEEDCWKAIVNGAHHVTADGLIIAQGFITVDPDEMTDLHFPSTWFDRPFPYRTLMLDMREIERGWQEIFRWENGRCKRLLSNLGGLTLNEHLTQA